MTLRFCARTDLPGWISLRIYTTLPTTSPFVPEAHSAIAQLLEHLFSLRSYSDANGVNYTSPGRQVLGNSKYRAFGAMKVPLMVPKKARNRYP
jgi:hypothetical protein